MGKEVNEIVYKLIGICIELHKVLGPGFPVEVYKKALEIELKEKEFSFESDKEFTISYKEVSVGTQKIDFLVNGSVILEIRSMQEDLLDLEIQKVLRMLPITGAPMGLLFNFGTPKIQYKRILPSRAMRGETLSQPRLDKPLRPMGYRETGRTRENNPIQ